MGCNFPVGAFNGLPTGSCCHQAPNSQAFVKKQLLLTAVKKGDENEQQTDYKHATARYGSLR
jgi:hypothetical protein